MAPPSRDRDNEGLKDFEDEIDPGELEELNRSTSASTFLEQRWWKWAAIAIAALVLASFTVPVLMPLFQDNAEPPAQGMQVPDFMLESPNNGTVILSDALAANDYVVLVFYRGFF
ncbi:MAG: hypothetical protein WD645_02715 [Dehalococcoidia bacterium]